MSNSTRLFLLFNILLVCCGISAIIFESGSTSIFSFIKGVVFLEFPVCFGHYIKLVINEEDETKCIEQIYKVVISIITFIILGLFF